MKLCPQCRRVYSNKKSFCMYDGKALVDSEAVDLLVDRVLDNKYSIDYRLAEGGTSTIYHGTHLQLKIPVAVKVMRRQLADDPIAIERFRREAYAAMRVRHPNAVAVLDFGITEDRQVYVVMELLVGQLLADRLKQRGSLPLAEVGQIVQQIAAALSVAHARGIVHRDLKPENIFLQVEDGRETVKVLDFGIARVQELSISEGGDLTMSGTIIGTPHYISPEQASGQAVDPRSDIYSLGVLTYQMLTGQVPFDGPSTMIVLLKQLNERPVPPIEHNPDIPERLNNLILAALEKDPRARPQTVESFAKQFLAIAEEQGFSETLSRTLEPSHVDWFMKPLEETIGIVPSRSQSPPKESKGGSVCARLSWFDLAAVVYTLGSLEETGLLTLHNCDLIRGFEDEVDKVRPFAWVYLERGKLTKIKLGVRSGAEAFYQLFQMPIDGVFKFRHCSEPAELQSMQKLDLDIVELTLEAMNLRTLLERYTGMFPDLLVTFQRQAKEVPKDLIGSEEIKSLASFLWDLLGEGVTLSELLARSPQCNAKTYQALAALLATGKLVLLRFTPSIDSSDEWG
ncbi:MAG: serine/threonine-protein kinase [Acidobacteriota bacterium]|nr:serine/threonine protein kinase [Blastocatellia bacterium]MDW8411907.1 serine/threonine-protein kinase [Acidobacteriota bacterium]